jgi:hypothetical protein
MIKYIFLNVLSNYKASWIRAIDPMFYYIHIDTIDTMDEYLLHTLISEKKTPPLLGHWKSKQKRLEC